MIEVMLIIKMNIKGLIQFVIVSVFKKEIFVILEDEVVIKLIVELEVEIDILKGMFDKVVEL